MEIFTPAKPKELSDILLNFLHTNSHSGLLDQNSR